LPTNEAYTEPKTLGFVSKQNYFVIFKFIISSTWPCSLLQVSTDTL